jgi:hypothetical protein
MSENPLPTALSTSQAIEAKGRSTRNRVAGKLKIVIEALILEDLPRAAAAEKAGMVDSSLRSAAARAGAPQCRVSRPADLTARQERPQARQHRRQERE